MAQSAPSEAPSCSPFGKKKKYKDKYLAKHSSSKLPGHPLCCMAVRGTVSREGDRRCGE